MQPIDGYYLYKVGGTLHPLEGIHDGWTYGAAWLPFLLAEGELERFITASVFHMPAIQTSGRSLLNAIRLVRTQTEDKQKSIEHIDAFTVYNIKNLLSAFEAVLSAEFGIAAIFLVTQKRGYDTRSLIDNGAVLFPAELAQKVPEAITDVNAAARCLAFELPTAAGFHLHRANESVLHKYFCSVAGSIAPPSTRNMGDYLKKLNDNNLGDDKVLASLKDLKDLHRNPLIHPQDTLESVDEAIALMGSVQAVIVHMLKSIPTEPTTAIV